MLEEEEEEEHFIKFKNFDAADNKSVVEHTAGRGSLRWRKRLARRRSVTCPRRTRPVSRPCASGLQTIVPMPWRCATGSTSRSMPG